MPKLSRIPKKIARLLKGAVRRICIKLGLAVNYGNNPKAGRYYNINGIKLYVEVYGSGKPLLMLHGNGGSIAAFTHNIPYFSKRYQVIAVDSRAHGKSMDAGDDISFEMMADDFAALLDVMQIPACYILGWSDGGITAMLMALHHPQKVLKLAATGANLTPKPEVFAPWGWENWERYYHQHRNKPRNTAKERNDWKLFMLDYQQPQLEFEELRNIKCPALIICGDNEVITVEHIRKIAAHIPQGQLWVVPNSGHATLIEHASLFNNRVERFFEE